MLPILKFTSLCVFFASASVIYNSENEMAAQVEQQNKTKQKEHCIHCFDLWKEAEMLVLFCLASYILLLMKII